MKDCKSCAKLNIGTFNVRGCSSELKRTQLLQDFENYKLDILCIQESKTKNGGDWTYSGHRFILFESDSQHYGNGFIMNKTLVPSIIKTWCVSHRLCALEISLKSSDKIRDKKIKSLTILNSYAPTTALARNKPESLDEYSNDLQTTYNSLTNNTFPILAGDYNSKVGSKKEGKNSIGSYPKGYRNENGDKLIEFCEQNKLFISNTAFKKAARHRATWIGCRKDKDNNTTIHIYNQIDFIICKQQHKHLINNAQSFGGTIISSDHKLVKTTIDISKHSPWKVKEKTQCATKTRLNIAQLGQNKNVTHNYTEQLGQLLSQVDEEQKLIQNKFRDDNIHDEEPYFGQARKLKSSITEKEVRASINNLNNGRALGSDNISGEFLKFAPHLIDNKIAKILNQTFERHEDLNINEGLLSDSFA
ncbi:craniofacial development protein 2-like [Elysia marginata]|uniref:Craniofacial development protein 2-like n=1 Tax=Elysia marginata TaxID=1093978 RepID=A0AAV4IJ57_9GAST|nr:craniofacial development protein 2-like [Elysia marginata]